MLLDHFIMVFMVMVFVAPGIVYNMIQTFGDSGVSSKYFMGNYYLNILGFSLYFNKDLYLGRSLAKRILNLQIVEVKTNRPATPLRCLVRNITIILWPIEVIVLLINSERRIGDFTAGTKLTIYDPEQHKEKINWALIVIALIIGILVSYFTMIYPMELLTNNTAH